MHALQPTRRVGGIIVAFLRQTQIGKKGVEDIHEQRSNASPAACVIAVDDQPCFRRVLREVVCAASQLAVVGEADSGEAAVELVRDLAPDMVLMDVRMPGIGGIEASRRIKALRPSTIVVLVSTTHPDALRSAGEPFGDEFVWKNELRPKLLEEIWRRHAVAGRPAPAPA